MEKVPLNRTPFGINKYFGGMNYQYEHPSKTCDCTMTFSVSSERSC